MFLPKAHRHPSSNLENHGRADSLVGSTCVVSFCTKTWRQRPFFSAPFLASAWPRTRSLINPTELTWPSFGGHNIWRWCPRTSRWVKHTWTSEVNTQPVSLWQDSTDGSYTSDLASWEGEEEVTFNWQLLQWREFSKKFYSLYVLSCLTLRNSFESLSPPFYRGSLWASESLRDLLEVIQAASGTGKIGLPGQHDSRTHGLLIL